MDPGGGDTEEVSNVRNLKNTFEKLMNKREEKEGGGGKLEIKKQRKRTYEKKNEKIQREKLQEKQGRKLEEWLIKKGVGEVNKEESGGIEVTVEKCSKIRGGAKSMNFEKR